MKNGFIWLLVLLMIPFSFACSGDISGDRQVTAEDILLIISAFGTSVDTSAPADLNRDGAVNIFDLVLVARQYGIVCEDLLVEDVHVKSEYPDSNYAGTQTLISDGDPLTIPLLKFDLRTVENIKTAQLQLTPTLSRTIEKTIHVANGSWDEATVTWNSMPILQEQVGSFSGTTVAGEPITISLDATTLNSFAGDYVTLAISDATDGYSLVFASQESHFPAELLLDASSDDTCSDCQAPQMSGIWVSSDAIAQLPTNGAAWEAMLDDAERLDPHGADISDQDSNHDVYTLAAALVCARTGEHCSKAHDAVMAAIGTEERTLTTPRIPPQNQWLPVGRNLGTYMIAADILDIRSTPDGDAFDEWARDVLDAVGTGGFGFTPFGSGSNAGAQEGFAYVATAAYLDDQQALNRAWNAFRTYSCDPTAPDNENIDITKGVQYGWAHNNDDPCAVNPIGTTKTVPAGENGAGTTVRIDGSIINDMRRGGDFQWEPGYTQYPWVGLEGYVPAALILERAGYPAFEVADQAVLRSAEYLWWLGQETSQSPSCTGACWWDYDRAREVKYLINWRYDTSYPHELPVGQGRTVGYTDWTHQD